MNKEQGYDASTHYFPEIQECGTCNVQYKCVCLYEHFHHICLGCGRQYLKYHPPYKEKIIRNYCINYGVVVEWYKDANLHNELGPAVQFLTKKNGIWTNKYKNFWFLDGKKVEQVFSQEEFLKSKEYREYKLKVFK